MDVLTHSVTGLLVGRLLEVPAVGRRRTVVLALVASNFVEVEGLQRLWDAQAAALAHHGAGHSLLALLAAPLLAWLVARLPLDDDARRPPVLPMAVVAVACWALHLLLDALCPEGIAALWPWHAAHLGLDWLSPADPAPAVLAAAALATRWVWPRARHLPIAGVMALGLYLGVVGAAHNVACNRAAALARKEGLDPDVVLAFAEGPGPLYWNTVAADEDEVIQRAVDLFRAPRQGFRYFRGLEEPLVEDFLLTTLGARWEARARVAVASSDLVGADRVEVWLRDLARFRRFESPDRGLAYDVRALYDDQGQVLEAELYIPPSRPRAQPPFPTRPRTTPPPVPPPPPPAPPPSPPPKPAKRPR